ncbi:MAG: InlB B-repeat-containing protein [Bacilli bacterium]|nr:InlB B-repeat-containing protein [Bacilli bacterium]
MKTSKLLTLGTTLLLGLGLSGCGGIENSSSSASNSSDNSHASSPVSSVSSSDNYPETSSDNSKDSSPVSSLESSSDSSDSVSSEPTVTMSESYRQGRERFHSITGVWLPEFEGVEDYYSYFDIENQATRFDFTGSQAIYSSLKTYLVSSIGNFQNEDQYGVYWEYDATVNEVEAKVNIDLGFYNENNQYIISLHGFVRNYYTVSLDAGNGGSVSLKMGSRVFENNTAKVNAGDYLILTASPNSGFEFSGWYIGEALLSKENPYTYRAPANNVTVVGKFAESTIQMTDSYASARNAFHEASDLWLPELESVTGMCEDLGNNMWMVDINGASEETLASVITAFDNQTNVSSVIDEFEKNVWSYQRNEKECELSAFYAEGMVVIMYQQRQLSASYAAGKGVFLEATGVDLPAFLDLEADIAFGRSYVMLDIVDGDNLTSETFGRFLSFFNELPNWSGQEDEHSSPEYPTYVYSNASTGASFQAVWNNESATGGIYLNVLQVLATFNPYAASKEYFETRFAISLPEMNGLSSDFSCASDSSWMTFDMTKENAFTEDEYNGFVAALSEKLGNGTLDDDEYQKRTTWTVGGVLWDVTWDLATSLAINLGSI